MCSVHERIAELGIFWNLTRYNINAKIATKVLYHFTLKHMRANENDDIFLFLFLQIYFMA